MDYLKCLAVGVFLAFAGGLAWIIRLLFSMRPKLPSMSEAVSYFIRSFVDERFLLAVLVSFLLGFFIEFMILKRGLLRAR